MTDEKLWKADEIPDNSEPWDVQTIGERVQLVTGQYNDSIRISPDEIPLAQVRVQAHNDWLLQQPDSLLRVMSVREHIGRLEKLWTAENEIVREASERRAELAEKRKDAQTTLHFLEQAHRRASVPGAAESGFSSRARASAANCDHLTPCWPSLAGDSTGDEMKFSEIEWKRQHEMAPDRSLVWAFGQRFVFASEILKGLNAGAVLLTTSDGFARVTSPEFAAERAEDLCVEFDPPNPDPLEDITGRLNAHEERLDDLCRHLRELRELRETLRQPVATTEPPIDVDTLRAICAWIGHVKHEGTMVAGPWNRWTLTGENGRWVRVSAGPSEIVCEVVLTDSDGREMKLTTAEAHDGRSAFGAGNYLRGR